MSDPNLIPESVEIALARGDSTVHYQASNGRENGPYDVDAFAIQRDDDRINSIRLNVEGVMFVATFPSPIAAGDIIL